MINHAPKFQRILKFTASGNLDMNRLMNPFYDLDDKFEAVRFWYLNQSWLQDEIFSGSRILKNRVQNPGNPEIPEIGILKARKNFYLRDILGIFNPGFGIFSRRMGYPNKKPPLI